MCCPGGENEASLHTIRTPVQWRKSRRRDHEKAKRTSSWKKQQTTIVMGVFSIRSDFSVESRWVEITCPTNILYRPGADNPEQG